MSLYPLSNIWDTKYVTVSNLGQKRYSDIVLDKVHIVHWTSFVFIVDLLMLIFKLMLMLRMEKETQMTVDLPAKAIHPQ